MLTLLAMTVFTQTQPQTFVAPGAKIETLASGLRFTEGPAELRDGSLIFSDIPANKIYQWKDGKLIDWRGDSRGANGNLLDRDGRVLTCEHGSRQVTRTDRNGKVEVLATNFEGKRLNSPNDISVRRDGTIYFTDPPYGVDPKLIELAFNGVFMLKRGKLSVIAKDFDRPNGIVLSPDEKFLYVADTAKNHIRRFEVLKDGSVTGGAEWAKTPNPDGLRVDIKGRVWSASGDGVNVIDLSGEVLEVIKFPQVPANLALSRNGKQLYVTARTAVYRLDIVPNK